MCYFLEPHGVLSQCVFITVFILQKRKLNPAKIRKDAQTWDFSLQTQSFTLLLLKVRSSDQQHHPTWELVRRNLKWRPSESEPAMNRPPGDSHVTCTLKLEMQHFHHIRALLLTPDDLLELHSQYFRDGRDFSKAPGPAPSQSHDDDDKFSK